MIDRIDVWLDGGDQLWIEAGLLRFEQLLANWAAFEELFGP